MAEGCCGCAATFDGRSVAYRRVLWVIIASNAAMFVVEVTAGYLARSQALQADALDFLADAATYALSLLVIGRPAAWRSNAALFKGLSLGALALWVAGSTLWRVVQGGAPEPMTMSSVGGLALAVNVSAALLLYRFRDGDANVRSVWLCSRNDAIGNIAVVFAAAGVWASGGAWPDLVVALAMSALFLHSATRIVRQAAGELRQVRSAPAVVGSAAPR
jgi:cation diffusion facilitator family transporter